MSRASHLRAARAKRAAELSPANGETQEEHDAIERRLRDLGLRPGTGGPAARHRPQSRPASPPALTPDPRRSPPDEPQHREP